MLKLLFTNPDGSTEIYVIDEDVYIGRVPKVNDICIRDSSLSRQHAQLKKGKKGFQVKDLDSLNGIVVNGKKVSQANVTEGDEIRLGNVKMECRYQNHPLKLEPESIDPSDSSKARFRSADLDEMREDLGVKTVTLSGESLRRKKGRKPGT